MKRYRGFSLLLLFLASAFSAGCQTDEIKAFSRLQPGMEKGQVVEIMGSPRRSERVHGADRWTYVFYHDDFQQEKEVRFLEGKSFYIGEVKRPDISAPEQDTINEKSNQELAAAFAEKRANNQKSSIKYEDFINQGSTQIRYVPTFKPVQ